MMANKLTVGEIATEAEEAVGEIKMGEPVGEIKMKESVVNEGELDTV